MAQRITHLLCIDPQNDFVVATGPGGEKGQLVVGGAAEDMARLASFITKNERRIDEIHCTLDSHQSVHIAHPIMWVNSKGEHPPVFSVITAADGRSGLWFASYAPFRKRQQEYLETLEKNGRYQLMVWPPHCLIGSWGAGVVPAVHAAMMKWEKNRFNRVNWVAKGSNFMSEHYSALMADVPDDSDPTTKINTNLLDALTVADEIVITGEALSHCVACTIRDIANAFGEDSIKKFTLLTDCSSNVYNCEKLGRDFVIEMSKRGMKLCKSTDW